MVITQYTTPDKVYYPVSRDGRTTPAIHAFATPSDFVGLTAADQVVDADGFLIPGAIVIRKHNTGVLLPATSANVAAIADGDTVALVDYREGTAFGIGNRIAMSNSNTDLTAAATVGIAVWLDVLVDETYAEKNLGRAYNADELAAISSAKSSLTLV